MRLARSHSSLILAAPIGAPELKHGRARSVLVRRGLRCSGLTQGGRPLIADILLANPLHRVSTGPGEILSLSVAESMTVVDSRPAQIALLTCAGGRQEY